MSDDLTNQVVVMTGAGGGIGRAVAFALAERGARLVVNDLGADSAGQGQDESVVHSLLRELEERGAEAIANTGDVRRANDVSALADAAIERFGRIDVWINLAGIQMNKAFVTLAEASFDAVLDVQLKGTLFGTQVAARHMKNSGGSIINTTALAGLQGNLNQANLAAAAGGVHALTRTASIDLQRHGIRVNAVAPLAKTRLTEDLPMFASVDSMRTEHVASAYAFYASPLSESVTGTVLAIAGGRLSTYELRESEARFKESDDGVWTPEEIGEHWANLR
jgi:NAD(P)-dependent dehydrogenase (short-subunit alcohol dehydrogenase family)